MCGSVQELLPGESGGISVVGREAHPDHDPVGPRVDVATDFARGHIPWDEPEADINLLLRSLSDLNGWPLSEGKVFQRLIMVWDRLSFGKVNPKHPLATVLFQPDWSQSQEVKKLRPVRDGDDVSVVLGEGAAEDGELVALERVLQRTAWRTKLFSWQAWSRENNLLGKTLLLYLALDITANCICEIHCLDGFDLKLFTN